MSKVTQSRKGLEGKPRLQNDWFAKTILCANSIIQRYNKTGFFLMPLLCMLFSALAFPTQGGAKNGTLPYYKMTAAIIPDAALVEVELVLTIPENEIVGNTVSFLFASGANVTSLSGEYVNSCDVNEAGPGISIYTIHFQGEIGLAASVKMVYSLHIPRDHPINRISADWIELNVDSFWHPVITSFPRFHFSMQLTLDNSFQILTGDHLSISDQKPDNWQIHSSIPRFDVSFSAAQNLYTLKGETVIIYSTVESAYLDSLLQLAEKSLAFLLEYTGRDEDFRLKRIIIESPRKESGYARGNYIVLTNLISMDPVHMSQFLTHEFSHFWFSNANPNSPDYWIDEAFAEVLAMIFIRETFGEEVFKRDVSNKLERAQSDPNPLAFYKERPSYIALYYTGPLILFHFEEFLGRDNFQLLIRNMIANKTSTNSELMDLIEKQFGPDAMKKLDELRNTSFSK